MKALKTPLHIFERLRVVCVDSTGPELRETQSVSGQALEFCPSEIFFFFHVGRNLVNFAPARGGKSFAACRLVFGGR